MYVCNYCKRVLKEVYEKCPGCGSSSFSTKSYLGEVVIKEPPKDGYKINIKNYKKKIKDLNIAIIICCLFMIGLIIIYFPFIIVFNSSPLFIILDAILPIVIIVFLIKKKNKIKKNIDRLENLCKKGILVKNMKYKIVNTGTMIAGHYYKCIEVNYKNAFGVEIPLYSETKYDIDMHKNDTVDLLIDPNDYSNYFIDYEIF